MNGPRLEGERVVLRPIESGDNRRIRAWRNSPEVHEDLFTAEKTTSERQQTWYRTYLLDPAQVRFVIEARDLGPVGCCGFTDIDEGSAAAKLTVFLGEARARGKGLAGEALGALLDWGFTRKGLDNIVAEVFADNGRAIKLYAKLGFKASSKGEPRRGRDVTVMQLDRSAWRKP